MGYAGKGELTPRQREIVALVAQGLAAKQIGRQLGIAEQTVKNILNDAYRRTGCVNAPQLVAWVMSRREGV